MSTKMNNSMRMFWRLGDWFPCLNLISKLCCCSFFELLFSVGAYCKSFCKNSQVAKFRRIKLETSLDTTFFSLL